MSDGFSFSFDTSSFEGGLDKLLEEIIKVVRPAVFLAGEALRADSVAIVPFNKGFNGGLAGSASTSPSVDEPDGITSVVGYNKVYAARLHEDMTLHISQKFAGAAPRQQKYLEKPARENAQKYGKIINDAVSTILK